MAVNIRKPGRGPRVEVLESTDFRGGLNLEDNWFSILPSQTPDCQNVDFVVNGGVRQRRAVAPWSTSAVVGSGVLKNMWRFDNQTGTVQCVAHVDDQCYYGSGGAWTSLGIGAGALAAGEYMNAVDFNGRLWIQRWGLYTAQRWTGAALVALTDNVAAATWQAAFTTPPGIGTHMPKARYIAAANEHVFIGYTVEGGTAMPNRVRWSHPGDPGSWRETDYVELDRADGDHIVAMTNVKDHLLVFKRNSVWAIYGYGYETFQVRKVADRIGTVSQRTVTKADGRVFFWDQTKGLYVYTPQSYGAAADSEVEWLGQPIAPIMFDRVDYSSILNELSVGTVDQQIWCSVPSSSGSDFTYVFDLRNGAWTRYKLASGLAGPMLEYDDGTRKVYWLLGDRSSRVVYKCDQDLPRDSIGTGSTATKIDSYYVTSWLHGGGPTFYKKWRRPELVFTDMSSTLTIYADVYKDYERTASRTLQWEIDPLEGSTTLVWDSGAWDSEEWGRETDAQFAEVVKGSSLGKARAVAFKFYTKTSEQVEWNLAQLTNKFKRKKVR